MLYPIMGFSGEKVGKFGEKNVANETWYTVEALLMDTLKSRQLYLRPPLQNPLFLNSHTNSVFLQSFKQPAPPVTDTFFAS